MKTAEEAMGAFMNALTNLTPYPEIRRNIKDEMMQLWEAADSYGARFAIADLADTYCVNEAAAMKTLYKLHDWQKLNKRA